MNQNLHVPYPTQETITLRPGVIAKNISQGNKNHNHDPNTFFHKQNRSKSKKTMQ
jgi:hypothetical protein